QPTAHLVGVLDDRWLLLYPEITYQFVAEAARRAGRVFPVESKTLLRRLDEAGLIEVEQEGDGRRRVINVWLNGATRRVIKLTATALEPISPSLVGEEREEREAARTRNETATGYPFADRGVAPALESARLPDLPGLPALPSPEREEA